MKEADIKILAERYGIASIYLFGSQSDDGLRYLKGKERSPGMFSDLDIAVAFRNPSGETFQLYGELYRELSELFPPYAVDLVFMHEVDTLFQYEIIKGHRIYEKDEILADECEESILKRAEDLSFKKKLFDREVMEAMEIGYFEFEYSPNP
jgi:predicted nucleotidyltransferase